MPARTLDELLRLTIGDLIVKMTILQAENEALKEQVAAAAIAATNGAPVRPAS